MHQHRTGFTSEEAIEEAREIGLTCDDRADDLLSEGVNGSESSSALQGAYSQRQSSLLDALIGIDRGYELVGDEEARRDGVGVVADPDGGCLCHGAIRDVRGQGAGDTRCRPIAVTRIQTEVEGGP